MRGCVTSAASCLRRGLSRKASDPCVGAVPSRIQSNKMRCVTKGVLAINDRAEVSCVSEVVPLAIATTGSLVSETFASGLPITPGALGTTFVASRCRAGARDVPRVTRTTAARAAWTPTSSRDRATIGASVS